MKKERCTNCGIKYPENLVQPLLSFKMGKLIQTNLCGICALEMTNKIHNIKREKFDSPGAEESRQAAIKWRAALERGEVK